MKRRPLSPNEMRVFADAIHAAVAVILASGLTSEEQLRVCRKLDGN